ncbi:MAG: hypothetical protein K2I45_10210 [Muribaculaceae bacterium]|nr:hypothetical protein [Muribaculaceae bacterium]
MKRNITALGAVMLIGLASASASHLTPAQWQEKQKTEAFRWTPESKASRPDWNKTRRAAESVLRSAPVTDSDVKMDPSENFYYLDMPDGATWFASVEIEKDILVDGEYYKEYDIVGVKATVYNDKYEKVGMIDTAIEKPEGFLKCSSIQFGSCVTKKFFNTNDNYELMLIANFQPEVGYGAVPYTFVYSLKGASASADHVVTLPGYYVTAINTATDAWSENFYMEFFAGEEETDTELFYNFDIYTKASYSSPTASKIHTFKVDMIYAMSDGENDMMPVMLKAKGNDIYVSKCQYEKTFFENPFDPFSDKLSEDNRYLIDLYKKGAWDNEFQLVSNTAIPVLDPEEGFQMRSYCLGGFEGYDDITFDYTSDGSPAFIVSVVNSDIYENSYSLFEIYNVAGDVIKTFGEGHEGFLRLSSVKGQPEQYCFLMPTGNGDYDLDFAFYDYPSMEKKASFPIMISYQNYDLPLSLALDRVADGASYSYAVASVNGLSDDNGDTSHLMAWFDKDGVFSHMDRLNAGKNINRISPYVSANGLNPWLMNTDDAREYMIFALRRNDDGSAAAHTELMVVNDREETVMQYAFKTTDNGIYAAIVNEETNPAIWISYNSADDGANHNEFISLPLNKFEGAGTVEDPYLIRTRGDFGQVAYNLNGNFRLANDIDYQGDEFKPITGVFYGSLDGAGHTVKNFSLEGGAMFSDAGSTERKLATFFRDLTLRGVTVTDAPAVLVGNAYAVDIDNVKIVNAVVRGEDVNDFGTIANNAATGSRIAGCGVKAEINLPETDEVGGLVSTLGNDTQILASSFSGTITASSITGGIAAASFASGSISDCHVTADISAGHTVGGIIGSSQRAPITRCVFEGALSADTPRMMWSDLAGGSVPSINVGGIAGILSAPPTEYDDSGNPKDPDPSLPSVITGCLVALDALDIPAGNDKLLETAHRIVGRSAINNDPQYLGEDYDETTGDWVIIWGEPAAPEGKISDNYAVDTFAPMHSEVADAHDSTEGKSVAYGDLAQGFFEDLGYAFAGYSNEEPWVMRDRIPALHFEGALGQYMEFQPGSVSGVVGGEAPEVFLALEEIEFDSLIFSSSNEDACYVNPFELLEDGVKVRVIINEAGVYTITASNGTLSAVLLVSGTSGVGKVEVSSLMTFDGRTLRADGCDITLHSLQGAAVAGGHGSVDASALGQGVYVAVAVSADGSRHTLKISVR